MGTEILPEDRLRVISRKDAKALGLKKYFTGKPCKKGHISERYVDTKHCAGCLKFYAEKRKNNPLGAKCKAEGCSVNAYAKGYCSRHYDLWKYHGDPLVRKYAYKGDALKWIEEHKNYQGDDCLKWPFATRDDGRGQVNVNGKSVMAHILMCQAVHGPRPEGLLVCHSCGRGHESCVNPKHLRYDTPQENAKDRHVHGTALFGEKNHRAKLKAEDIPIIRSMAGSMSYREIGEIYGVTTTAIEQVINRKRWRHIV